MVEIDFQVGLLQAKKTWEHVVVGISCLAACFMYGTRDRIFFVSGAARFHRHGEQWHEGLPMMKDGRVGHSGLTERPILNELRNATVLDMAICLVSPRAKLNIKT
jgi:hypothetical protein